MEKSTHPSSVASKPPLQSAESAVPSYQQYLFSGEVVEHVQWVDIQSPPAPISPREALRQLARVEHQSAIGQNGPLFAALPTRDHVSSKEFNLFQGEFGRDALWSSMILSETYPELLKSTIKRFASLQGTQEHDKREEQKGKIVHEHRHESDPLRLKLEDMGWEYPYYGSIDATPLFVNAISAYCRQHGDNILSELIIKKDGSTCTVRECFQESLSWISRMLEENDEGFLEYCRANDASLVNHVWKDSQDSYHHADEIPPNHIEGIASVEVQGYVYDALLNGADILGNDGEDALRLIEQAERLKENVFKYFWVDEGEDGYFALATDRCDKGEPRPMKVRTSNMGHLLHSRILDGNDLDIRSKRDAIAKNLFSPDMLNVSGIRTLAKNERFFRPFAYHNGTVWPWENWVIARGLRRHRYNKKAKEIEDKILVIWRQTGLLPEFVSGGEEEVPTIPQWLVEISQQTPPRPCGTPIRHRIAQPPQLLQAWTAAPVLEILERRKKAS